MHNCIKLESTKIKSDWGRGSDNMAIQGLSRTLLKIRRHFKALNFCFQLQELDLTRLSRLSPFLTKN